MKKIKEVNFKFNLGDILKDEITGFTGVAISRCQWINNCNVYGLKSQKLKDSVPIESQHFDEPQLELVETKAVSSSRTTGGPERVSCKANC